MKEQSYEEFMSGRETDAKVEKKEYFKVRKCPTPGCSSGMIRPAFHGGLITGFTCHHGCRYFAKRNKISGEIDYYELASFNHYLNTEASIGHRATVSGEPLSNWY